MDALADVSQRRRQLEAMVTSVAARSAEAVARLAQDSRDVASAMMAELRARRDSASALELRGTGDDGDDGGGGGGSDEQQKRSSRSSNAGGLGGSSAGATGVGAIQGSALRVKRSVQGVSIDASTAPDSGSDRGGCAAAAASECGRSNRVLLSIAGVGVAQRVESGRNPPDSRTSSSIRSDGLDREWGGVARAPPRPLKDAPSQQCVVAKKGNPRVVASASQVSVALAGVGPEIAAAAVAAAARESSSSKPMLSGASPVPPMVCPQPSAKRNAEPGAGKPTARQVIASGVAGTAGGIRLATGVVASANSSPSESMMTTRSSDNKRKAAKLDPVTNTPKGAVTRGAASAKRSRV